MGDGEKGRDDPLTGAGEGEPSEGDPLTRERLVAALRTAVAMADCYLRRPEKDQTKADAAQRRRLLKVVKSLEEAARKQRETAERIEWTKAIDEIAEALGSKQETRTRLRPDHPHGLASIASAPLYADPSDLASEDELVRVEAAIRVSLGRVCLATGRDISDGVDFRAYAAKALKGLRVADGTGQGAVSEAIKVVAGIVDRSERAVQLWIGAYRHGDAHYIASERDCGCFFGAPFEGVPLTRRSDEMGAVASIVAGEHLLAEVGIGLSPRLAGRVADAAARLRDAVPWPGQLNLAASGRGAREAADHREEVLTLAMNAMLKPDSEAE